MSARGPTKLVFVYNVDASPVAMLRDLWSGLTTGETDCRLCDLTFGRLMKDSTWKRFVEDLPVDVVFRMRSTFVREHPDLAGHRFPAGFAVDSGGEQREHITAAEIEAVDDLDGLRALVEVKVAALVE